MNLPRFPLVEFTLSIGTWETVDEAYPDTGFEGGVSIPAGVAREILSEPDSALLRLANDSLEQVPIWGGYLTVEGRRFRTDVVGIGTRYLLGRQVLDRLEICFEFGERVRLRFER